MPVPRAKQALAAQQRTEMLRMKNSGMRIADIAARFNISPKTASSYLSRAYRKARELEVQEAELHRHIQFERLETLLHAAWPDALEGDLKAGEQVRKYVADIINVMGLAIPVRTEISGPDGGAVPLGSSTAMELARLMGAPVPAPDPDDDGDEDDLDHDEEDEEQNSGEDNDGDEDTGGDHNPAGT